jgi:hypothetical protein
LRHTRHPTSAYQRRVATMPAKYEPRFHGSGSWRWQATSFDPFSRNSKYLIWLLALNHYLRRIFNSTNISQIPRERELASYGIWDIGAAILILEMTILSYDVVGIYHTTACDRNESV